MALIGLVSVARPREDLPGFARASLMAGGITLLERNVRLLRQSGADTVYVLVDMTSPKITDTVEKLRQGGEIILVAQALDLAGLLESGDRVVMIEEGVLVDARLVQLVLAAAETGVAVWPVGTPQGGRAVRLDASHGFGSVCVCRSETVRTVCKGLGDWDLEQTLLRAVTGDAGTVMVDVGSLPVRNDALRRDVPLLWQPMSAHPDEDVATELLVESAQHHVEDAPSRVGLPFVENSTVRLLAKTAVMPLHVQLLAAVTGIVAALAFAGGGLWPGVLLALFCVAPLEGIAGKLARVRQQDVRHARLIDGITKAILCLWVAALALNFTHVHGVVGPWSLAVLIVAMVTATEMQTRFFRKTTGTHFGDAGQAEQKIRMFGGQRPTFLWVLLAFGLFDAWYAGFAAVGLYALATFFVVQSFVLKRLSTELAERA